MLARILFLAVLMFSSVSQAVESQLHVRLGLVQGSYTGPQTGEFSIPTALDVEYEIFHANRRALILRSILAVELETSKPFYTYFGSGYRFYFGSKGMHVDRTDDNVTITSVPRWRYYFGFDAGISQAIIRSLGKVLQVTSTMVDLGAHVGTTYQIDRRIGLELQFGVTTGQGFSSVSVIGYTVRALGGVVYHF